MSSCRSAAAGTGNRDVLDWQHLHLLLLPSGTRAEPLWGGASRPQRPTPAMASGLTDQRWTLHEWLRYKVAPPPWEEPKGRGRPRRRPVTDAKVPKRPRGRPRTRPLPDPLVPTRPRGRPRTVPLSSFTGYWAVPSGIVLNEISNDVAFSPKNTVRQVYSKVLCYRCCCR